MKPRIRYVFLLLIGFVFSTLQTATALETKYIEGIDEAATLFNPLSVHEISLDIDANSFESINTQTDIYHHANLTLTTEAGTYGPMDVGIRLKGTSSFQDLSGKPSIKIKLNEFVPGQKILGLKRLTLNAMNQDATMVHETIAYRLYRALGIAAPRTGYSKLKINAENYGLYLFLETIDRKMLKQHFPDTVHLYDGLDGKNLKLANLADFSVVEGDASDTSDLVNFLTIQNLESEEWFNAMESNTNFVEILLQMATDLYVGLNDSYVNALNPNYYLHFGSDGKASFIPWGTDQTFMKKISFTPTTGSAEIFKKCISVQACEELFLDQITLISDKAEEIGFFGYFSEVSNFLEPFRQADLRRSISQSRTVTDLATTSQFIESRNEDVYQFLTKPKVPVLNIAKTGKLVEATWQSDPPRIYQTFKYKLQYKINKGTWIFSDFTSTQTWAMNFNPGDKISFRLRSETNLEVSPWSEVQTVKISPLPTITSLAVKRKTDKYKITWSAETFNESNVLYEIMLRREGSDWEKTSDLAISAFEVTATIGALYEVKVRAITDVGQSEWSEVNSFGIPEIPTIKKLNFTSNAKEIKITWTGILSPQLPILKYEVSQSANGLTWSSSKLVTKNVVTFIHKKGATFYYRIRAITELGPTSWSNAIVYTRK